MRKRVREEIAEQEAAWFFRELGGVVPKDGDAVVVAAAITIDGWLREIPAYHRGVLSLRYLPKEWPADIVAEFGELASLVIRIEATLHPAVGVATDALENASVERIRLALATRARATARLRPLENRHDMCREEKIIARLECRAFDHTQAAYRAIARVRGDGPSVVPAKEGA